ILRLPGYRSQVCSHHGGGVSFRRCDQHSRLVGAPASETGLGHCQSQRSDRKSNVYNLCGLENSTALACPSHEALGSIAATCKIRLPTTVVMARESPTRRK